MNRKLVSFLILIVWILVFFFTFLYVFVGKTWKIVVVWWENDYKITLKNKKNNESKTYSCTKQCVIEDLPRVSYNLKATSKWFNDYETVINLDKEVLKLDLTLEKKYHLADVTAENSNIKKITRIKNRKLISENIAKIENADSIYVANLKWDIINISGISNSAVKDIYSVKKTGEKSYFKTIYSTKWVLFSNWSTKIIIDWTEVYDFKLASSVTFVKEISNKKYLLHTDDWVFIFDKSAKSLEYFSLFDDFFYNKKWDYAVLVRKTNKSVKDRFNIAWFRNTIGEYNPKTKEFKVIYETDYDIKNIFSWDDWEYNLITSSSDIYKLTR